MAGYTYFRCIIIRFIFPIKRSCTRSGGFRTKYGAYSRVRELFVCPKIRSKISLKRTIPPAMLTRHVSISFSHKYIQKQNESKRSNRQTERPKRESIIGNHNAIIGNHFDKNISPPPNGSGDHQNKYMWQLFCRSSCRSFCFSNGSICRNFSGGRSL